MEDKEDYLEDFVKEVEINQKLQKHPHIVRYIKHWQNGNDFYIVTEYCKGGSLFDYLYNIHRNETIP